MTTAVLDPAEPIAFKDAHRLVRGMIEVGVYRRDDPGVRRLLSAERPIPGRPARAGLVLRVTAPAHLEPDGETMKVLVSLPGSEAQDVEAAKWYGIRLIGWRVHEQARAGASAGRS